MTGDTAGLALLNHPYAWIGVSRDAEGLQLQQFDQGTGKTISIPFSGGRIHLRAHCDFLTEKAVFSYSIDGTSFEKLGGEFDMIFQLRTFQGVRYAIFNYNRSGSPGGHADFDKFTVDEPRPSGFTKAIPSGQTIILAGLATGKVIVVKNGNLTAVLAEDPLASSPAARFRVHDRKLGRISLQSVPDGRVISVTGLGEAGKVSLAAPAADDGSQQFQWTEMPRGDILFLSLASHRHLRIRPDGTLTADEPGARHDRKNGASFTWRLPDVD